MWKNIFELRIKVSKIWIIFPDLFKYFICILLQRDLAFHLCQKETMNIVESVQPTQMYIYFLHIGLFLLFGLELFALWYQESSSRILQT